MNHLSGSGRRSSWRAAYAGEPTHQSRIRQAPSGAPPLADGPIALRCPYRRTQRVVANGAATIVVSLSGQLGVFYLTDTFITGPLLEAEVDTFNVGRPVRASLVKSLVATVANRAAGG
jgi:hypothetical protein